MGRSIFMILLTLASVSGDFIFAGDVSLENNTLLLTPSHGDDGGAWGQRECVSCHVRRNIHATAPAIKDIVQKVGYTSCAGCHGQNGTDIQQQCTVCHNETLLPRNPLMENIKNHNFSTNKDARLIDKECIACHDSSDMDGDFEPDIDLTHFIKQGNGLDLPYQSQSDFCLRCHNQGSQQPNYPMLARFSNDPLVSMAKNYQFIDMHGKRKGSGKRTYAGLRDSDYEYGTLVECTDCHAMHGTHNEKLIIDRTDTGAFLLKPALREKPVLIHVEGGNYAQQCVVCHESKQAVEATQSDAGNGLSGVHKVTGSCVTCHTHGMAVQTGL